MSDPARIVVVGAGIGGLSAAIRLARLGARVVVVERNAVPGGKMGEHREAGFRFDTGPSVITMRPVLEDLYATAGTRLGDELELVPADPLTRYRWDNGTLLDVRPDLDATLEGIREIEPRDVDGYRRYLDHARELHRITAPLFIHGPSPSLRTFVHFRPRAALRLGVTRSLHADVARHVVSPQIRQLLSRFATYVGANPYRAPSTLGVIAHVELNEGVWYPRGGVHAIARSLTGLAERCAVELRTGIAAERIEVVGGRARAVVLADGTRLDADAVVANVDVATVVERLLPDGTVGGRRRRRLLGLEPSLSGFIALLGVRGRHPALAHHTILFSSDYRREFDEIDGRGVPPAEPTVYLAITSRTDPADAPDGHENWFVLVNAPPLGPGWSWSEPGATERYRDLVLARIAAFGHDVAPADRVVERLVTPLDLEERTGARRGALYGLSSSRALSAFQRPPNRDPDVRGLYHVGGTTHPGGGVPMVMLSGRLGASFVARDLGLARRD